VAKPNFCCVKHFVSTTHYVTYEILTSEESWYSSLSLRESAELGSICFVRFAKACSFCVLEFSFWSRNTLRNLCDVVGRWCGLAR